VLLVFVKEERGEGGCFSSSSSSSNSVPLCVCVLLFLHLQARWEGILSVGCSSAGRV
jgi:hypothetical protein